jgi:hypothetical protein
VVEIFVKPFGATKYQSLNLIENVSLPITYSIADIRNPDKREGTFTKTISLPGTKTNNTLFSNIFNISKVTTGIEFNPNKKADCLILEDSIEILKGSLRLADISYFENGEIMYNCIVYGETSDLFFSISNDKLTDLDLSEFDHDWSGDNIQDSWTATKGIGYVYPMIDYGTNQDIMKARWDVIDFYPAIYVKQYIDKIFASAGYTYTSAFFNSDFFKSLIIPFNKESLKLTSADILKRSASVSMLADDLINVTINRSGDPSNKVFNYYNVFQNWDWTKEVSDPNNNFLTDGFQAPKNGLYDIDLFFDCSSSDIVTFPSGTSAVADRLLRYSINLQNLTTATTLASDKQVLLIQDSVSVLPVKTPFRQRIYLTAGDVIKVDLIVFNSWTFTTTSTGTTGTASFGIDNDSYFKITAVEQLSENSPIAISSIIPENILCKDFISGLIKMFNLYFEPDKNNVKNIIVKTRDSFYSDTTQTLDWTDKVNRDIPWKITPMGELDFKKLTFTYKDDQDYFNKLYKSSHQENYGTKNEIIDNDFLSNEKKIDPLFSATPSYRPLLESISNRIYPVIVNDQRRRTGSNIRILMYAGLTFCDLWTYYSKTLGGVLKNTYPFAGMVNDADNPTYDLSFDVPYELYWSMNQANYTNNNLYNTYYYKMISEIKDVDSKLVEMEVLLTAQDLFNINFAKKIFIDNQYYILNKIIDADRTQTQLCTIELLKLKVGNSFTPSIGVSKNFGGVQATTPTVDGGKNIIGSSLNGTPAIVEGGLNEVRSIGATSEILIVNGGN